jgi:hypothetical protein
MVVFDREVIRTIKSALINMPPDDLIEGSSDIIDVLKQNDANLVEKALKQGPLIGTELAHGIILATGKRDGSATGPWCAIYVSQVKVQAEATAPPAERAEEVALMPAIPAVGLVEPEAVMIVEVSGQAALLVVDSATIPR